MGCLGGRGVDGSPRAHHNTDCGQPMLTPFQLPPLKRLALGKCIHGANFDEALSVDTHKCCDAIPHDMIRIYYTDLLEKDRMNSVGGKAGNHGPVCAVCMCVHVYT